MILLHLSDIHFRHGYAGTALDPDHYLRSEILLDVERMQAELGPADAVLVSGDVAFGGHPDEYGFAADWLYELCRKCQCDPKNVFVCPGNHDVVREVTSRWVIQGLHGKIKAAGDNDYMMLIRNLLVDPEAGKLLYEALANYNLFAVQYFCDMLPPDRTIARRRLPLNDGSMLELLAFNSAFVSSAQDAPRQLYVDPACFQLERTPGVEHLVMCHHPFHWIRGGDRLEDHLSVTTRIQLFGHDHTNRILPARDWVRIAAAAVHPERRDPGWEPGYNWLRLEVLGGGDARQLEVTAFVRVWQERPDQFRAKTDRKGHDYFRQVIDLEPWAPSVSQDQPTSSLAGLDGPMIDLAPTQPEDQQERSDPMNSLRDLSLRFFKLSLSQKSAIAGQLGLLEEEDVNMPDFERFRRVFVRARDRGLVTELDRAVGEALSPNLAESRRD